MKHIYLVPKSIEVPSSRKGWRQHASNLNILLPPVGSWDFSPLPTHTLPVSGHSGGSSGRQQHDREAGEEQTAPPISWERREACSRAKGCQIRGVLCSDTGMRHCWVFITLWNWFDKPGSNNSLFLNDHSLSLFLFSATSEDLRMCLTRPSWQHWSLLRWKTKRGVSCYRWTTTTGDVPE